MKYFYFKDVQDAEDFKKKFKLLCKSLHPDLNPGENGNKFKEMMKEYETLSYSKAFAETHSKGFGVVHLKGKEKIDILYDQAILKGWKTSSVYYTYKEYLMMRGEEPELDDLQYLGDLLGYSKTWAIIKYNEILNELNRDSLA